MYSCNTSMRSRGLQSAGHACTIFWIIYILVRWNTTPTQVIVTNCLCDPYYTSLTGHLWQYATTHYHSQAYTLKQEVRRGDGYVTEFRSQAQGRLCHFWFETVSAWILLCVAVWTIIIISRQNEVRSRDYALLLSNNFKLSLYRTVPKTLQTLEQLGTLYMHIPGDKYPTRLWFETIL